MIASDTWILILKMRCVFENPFSGKTACPNAKHCNLCFTALRQPKYISQIRMEESQL